MTYLLDTVVLSEMRKRHGDPNVLRWLRGKEPQSMFVSVVTIGEMQRGVDRERQRNPVFAEALGAWLDQTIAIYEDRILSIDIGVARRWGRLSARIGHHDPDLLIAATALEHGLTVATRNVRHFVPTGVSVENPFDG